MYEFYSNRAIDMSMLVDDSTEEINTRATPVRDNMRRYAQFAGAAFLLVAATAIATYFLTRKMMGSSENSASTGRGAVCPEINTTGVVTLYNVTDITSYNATDFTSATVETAIQMGQWMCNQLLCDAAVMKNLLDLAMPFITRICEKSQLFHQFVNATSSQCAEFTKFLVSAYVKGACNNKLIGTALNMNDNGYSSRYDIDRQRRFNITQP